MTQNSHFKGIRDHWLENVVDFMYLVTFYLVYFQFIQFSQFIFRLFLEFLTIAMQYGMVCAHTWLCHNQNPTNSYVSLKQILYFTKYTNKWFSSFDWWRQIYSRYSHQNETLQMLNLTQDRGHPESANLHFKSWCVI